VLPVGALLARFGQDRWLSAGGGVLCGADVMALRWSLLLQAFTRAPRAIGTDGAHPSPRAASLLASSSLDDSATRRPSAVSRPLAGAESRPPDRCG